MSELTFTDVRPDDDATLRRWYALAAELHHADRAGDPLPGFRAWSGHITTPPPGTDNRLVLVWSGDDLVGWLGLWLHTLDNVDAATAELAVHPAHRRRGYGRAIVEEWTRRAKELGRTRLLIEAAEGAGSAFATELGFRGVLADTQRRLDLDQVDDERLSALLADARAHAGGYTVVQWVGPSPEEHLAGLAALESRMTTDAPMDDLAWEQEVYDADRFREHEQTVISRGTRVYTTAVVQDSTGEVVGSTTVGMFEDAPEGAYQFQTIVDPDHRGHRLGMLLKLANLESLRAHEPAVRTVDTWNADSNAHMLRVNLAMGFEVVRQWSEYERPV